MKQHGVHGGKYLLKTPGNAISETLKFQDVPRCLSPQELVPLVQVPKLPTIHYQLAAQNSFDSPEQLGSSFDYILMLMLVEPLGENPDKFPLYMYMYVRNKRR